MARHESSGFALPGPLKRLFEDPEGADDAVALLKSYFTPLPDGIFEGGGFERFAGGGDRPGVADRFTSDDVVAVTMLSVSVPPASAFRLLVTDADRFGRLLAEVGEPGPCFTDLSAGEIGESWAVRDLYREIAALSGVGETTATKLIARKRPHLVPIIDSIVRSTLGVPRGPYWAPLHQWLTTDGNANARRLSGLRDAAGLAGEISVIRVFDVITWLVGTGKSDLSCRRPQASPVL